MMKSNKKPRRMKKVEKNVIELLKAHYELRNNDNALVLAYWNTYNGISIIDFEQTSFFNIAIKLSPAGSIIRARARIQNELHLYPPDPETANAREEKELEVRISWLERKRSNEIDLGEIF
jgi:hypothetical protein